MQSALLAAIFIASISTSPSAPIQGDPMMISVDTTSATTTIQSISFDGTPLGVFSYKGKPTALYGVDLNKKPGTYSVVATLSDGTSVTKDISVVARKRVEAPLGIPEKLGGNTSAAATTLVSTLAQENATFIGLRTGDHAFWTKPFIYPTVKPEVTDSYGYQRQTGEYSIAHKGADFRAAEGTPVVAMNRGVVRINRLYRNYGNTVVVDHGLGLMTFYMHLSKSYVNVGELVLPEQLIGLSGQTGYAEAPHLHVTVRLNNISIDPIAFLKLFSLI